MTDRLRRGKHAEKFEEALSAAFNTQGALSEGLAAAFERGARRNASERLSGGDAGQPENGEHRTIGDAE